MNTAILVPFSIINSDLKRPAPYRVDMAEYLRGFGTDILNIADRNWAIDKWRIEGSATVTGSVIGYATSPGSFIAAPDPGLVTLTATFSDLPVTEQRPQPNFGVEDRSELINFINAEAFSPADGGVFPFAVDSTATPVGGAAIRLRLTVVANMTPYYILTEEGARTVYPSTSIQVSATIGFENPDYSPEEGTSITTDPNGGTFPFFEPVASGGQITITDISRSPEVQWGSVQLGAGGAVIPIDLDFKIDTRFSAPQ